MDRDNRFGVRKFHFSPVPFAFCLISFGLATHAPFTATAAVRPSSLASPRVHPEAVALFSYRARTGKTFPAFRRNQQFEQSGRLPVVVRYRQKLDSQKRDLLLSNGISFAQGEPTASGAWLATVTEEGLRVLGSDPEVVAVSVDLFRDSPRPDDAGADDTTASLARRVVMAREGRALDGKGIVIADIDGSADFFHPAFFHADGPVSAWTDVDADGKLTPGVDGIDRDADGSISPPEVLHDLRSSVVVRSRVVAKHPGFEPDLDYLYLDENGNGQRDHGPNFGEEAFAYGEPLFVFDDANHDQQTQISERVIQLKTSKFKAIVSKDKTFLRGDSGRLGLIHYRPESDPLLVWHATAVAGIIAGGQPGISRWLGIAPGADIVLNEDHDAQRGAVSAVQWAINQKANVILTEYAIWAGISLDGSSEDEKILDAANDKGIVTVSPAGNLANSRKHRTLKVLPAEQTFGLHADSSTKYVSVSFHYRGPERKMSLRLLSPDKSIIEIPESAPEGIVRSDGSSVHALSRTSDRGTHERFFYWMAPEGSALLSGAYELTVGLDGAGPLEVDAYTFNAGASWSGGFTFDEDTPSRTMCNPATSNKTIAVGAHVLHDDPQYFPEGLKGELTSSSSRGPRIDNVGGVALSAPANPLTPAPRDGAEDGVAWIPFGGTSGAGAHVAGAIALLMQAHPEELGPRIRDRLLLKGTRPMAGDRAAVGNGKLDIARALEATLPSGGMPRPRIEFVGPSSVGTDARVRLMAEDDEPGVNLRARWDLDYDGIFDTEWLPLGEQNVQPAMAGRQSNVGVKAEVRDGQGNVNGATTIVHFDAQASEAASSPVEGACSCTFPGSAPSSKGLLSLLVLPTIAGLVRSRRRKRCA